MEYIKLRRVAKASEALLDKNKRILDIALDLGFSSHEIFTRTFKSTYGLTPEEYRANPVRLNNFCMPQHKLSCKPFAIERYANHSPETTNMEIWVMPVPME